MEETVAGEAPGAPEEVPEVVEKAQEVGAGWVAVPAGGLEEA